MATYLFMRLVNVHHNAEFSVEVIEPFIAAKGVVGLKSVTVN